MNYLYIPLDDRPCNMLFPCQLAHLQNVQVKSPSASLLGSFTRSADFEAIKAWLFENAAEACVLVLSVDAYVYGSLLDSRTMMVDIEESARRMESIKALKKDFPGLKIYAFSVIMRTSISTFSELAIETWSMVNDYSQLKHKVALFSRQEDIEAVAALEKKIPQEVLKTFLDARKRNHSVNKCCVEYLRDGIFNDLSLTQEDSTPYGMHKQEQETLTQNIKKYNLENRARIHNGTDEGGCVALARGFLDMTGKEVSASYFYLNDRRTEFVASYEDRLFHENLISQLLSVGIRYADGDEACENQLFIYSPAKQQYEASVGQGSPPCDYNAFELDSFAKRIADAIISGKRVFLLDVAYANGGHGEILRRIDKYAPSSLHKLAGYSAWNTASNALGTILSQIVFSENANEEENRRFTAERILDDYAYQGVVRQRVKEILNQKGEDTLSIKDKDGAECILREQIELFLKEERFLNEFIGKIDADLPWPRLFEAKILLK